MTEAKLKKKNSKAKAKDERISTHPSYKEYSWDTLTAPGTKPVPVSHKNGIGQQMNDIVAGTSTGSFGRVNAPSSRTGEFTTPKNVKTGVSAGKAKAKSKAVAKEKSKKLAKVKTKVEYLTTDVEAARRYSFPVSLVLMAVCATVLIMAIITTGVQINEITAQNSSLKSQYSQLEELRDELSRQLEVRDDLRVVERMAKEELGMVKRDQVDRYYLTVHKEDKIEIIEDKKQETTSFWENIKDAGDSLVNRIRAFFGMN